MTPDAADARAAAKHLRLQRMRLLATILLAFMAAVLVAAVALKPRFPWLVWVEAFVEASLVGGLADWFAVVALFRHPLGLPIPHTAILPRNKDRIGTELGLFVEQNFLTPENLSAKLREIDLIGPAARWLADPANSRNLAEGLRGQIPRLLGAVDEAEARRFLALFARVRLEALDLAGLAGTVLGLIQAGGRHQDLFDRMLHGIGHWLDRNRDIVKARIGAQSRLTPRFVDSYVANRFIDGVIDLIAEIGSHPTHELRPAFDQAVSDMIDRLRHTQEYRAEAERLKHVLLETIDLDRLMGAAWHEIRQRLNAEAAEPSGDTMDDWLAEMIGRLGRDLAADPVLLAAIDAEGRRLIEAGLVRFRHQFSVLIADTVRRWDARAVAAKIELEVGRDLQFIRLNGTLVGGLAGLGLHAAMAALGLL